MSEWLLQVENLCKDFRHFSLQNISFQIPPGQIVGIIGENGSGKSTLIKCILNQEWPTSGLVKINGLPADEASRSHEMLAFIPDECPFSLLLTPNQIAKIFSGIYTKWDEEKFDELLKEFNIPKEQKLKEFSKGMRVKVTLAAALSHHARMIIMDEGTSGLDPIVREQILEQIQDYIQKEEASLLMTSHISSDLEQCADWIYVIVQGKIVFSMEKDSMLQNLIKAKLSSQQLEFIDPDLILAIQHHALLHEVLINDRHAFCRRYPDYVFDPISLDDILLFISKGERK